MKTKQQTFDAVYLGLAAQDWRQSASVTGSCRYRYEDEGGQILRCAAGQLIPDSRYYDDLEFSLATDWKVGSILTDLGYDRLFVREMQKIHDGSDGSTDYTQMDTYRLKAAFDAFAVKHELTIPEVPS